MVEITTYNVISGLCLSISFFIQFVINFSPIILIGFLIYSFKTNKTKRFASSCISVLIILFLTVSSIWVLNNLGSDYCLISRYLVPDGHPVDAFILGVLSIPLLITGFSFYAKSQRETLPDTLLTKKVSQNSARGIYTASGILCILTAFYFAGYSWTVDQIPPICTAAARGDMKWIEHYANRGGNLNVRDFIGKSALHHAAGNNRKDVAEYLCSHGVSPNSEDHRKNTPLYEAVILEYPDMARYLIEQGADVNARNEDGDSPLTAAAFARANNLEVVKLLVDRGAEINNVCIFGSTPLYGALERGKVNVANFLILKGADVNTHKTTRESLLGMAVSTGNFEIVKLLIERGSEVNSKDRLGDTPLHEAVRLDRRDIAELLIANGADVNALDGSKQTPLDLAIVKKCTEIADLLERHKAKTNRPYPIERDIYDD